MLRDNPRGDKKCDRLIEVEGSWNIRRVGKCDRLYEGDYRSEYQILVVEKRPYMRTQIPMMKIYHCQVK
ncbi:hypothetical protein [Cylindrospermopsis raciborskii]|uniref:hypothetical protein n=1 Tax=Cylindrospermopsis raciborskii TaxID=77022 RepID=UPI0002FBFD01|nr:hypothetical protein [Cylindrospermopsis raciborskii]